MKDIGKLRTLLADIHRARAAGLKAIKERNSETLKSAIIGMEVGLQRLRLQVDGYALMDKDRTYPAMSFIDATPDGNYAQRILQYYREACNSKWSENADGSVKNPVLIEMNRAQELRAAELDEAIRLLHRR